MFWVQADERTRIAAVRQLGGENASDPHAGIPSLAALKGAIHRKVQEVGGLVSPARPPKDREFGLMSLGVLMSFVLFEQFMKHI